MPELQQLAQKGRLMYGPTLFLCIGLILGWLLCKGGVG